MHAPPFKQLKNLNSRSNPSLDNAALVIAVGGNTRPPLARCDLSHRRALVGRFPEKNRLKSWLLKRCCSLSDCFGGRTRARTWDPLIKRHATTIDFSREFSQQRQNPIITDQWLTRKNPTARHVL